MRRYLILIIAALVITAPACSMSKMGQSQARNEMPTPSPTLSSNQSPTPTTSPTPTSTPTPSQEERKGDVEAGKARYLTDCKKCHGDQGQGNPAMYKMLKATVVHLGSAQAQQRSDEEIRKAMTHGFGKMEAIKGLSPADVENILAFVRTLKQ